MRKTLLLLLAILIVACPKKQETTSTTTTALATTSSAAPTATAPLTHSAEDLVGLSSGAVIVQKPEAPEAGGEAWYMLDEDPKTGWCSQSGKASQPTVIELPDRSVIKSVSFDTALDETDGRVPKQILVEMSDTSATDGFKPIADITTSGAQKDGETFNTTADVPGRWVRLTVKQTSSGDITQIMEFRAFGERLTHNPPPNVTGSYKTDFGELNLKQDGTTVTGCYTHAIAPLVGGMEGRLLKFEWNGENDQRGPAIAIFSNDGTVFGGYWKVTGVSAEHPILDPFTGKKTSDQPGNCPQWKPPQDVMGEELKKSGRVRLYGINFDSDSDVIRDESKPTLDQVVTMLKSNGDLKITIEGHTDNTSTPDHNQQLSERRAKAVKDYLVKAGVDGARLETAGFGATKPVASNDSALGRAENRRVELVKR